MDTTTPSPKLSSNNAALLAVALSLGAVICGAAAGAANADTTPPASETISISDLDLSTADGARAFLKRIDIAAQRASGSAPRRAVGAPANTQMPLFTEFLENPALAELRAVDLDKLTPLAAFDLLRSLRARL